MASRSIDPICVLRVHAYVMDALATLTQVRAYATNALATLKLLSLIAEPAHLIDGYAWAGCVDDQCVAYPHQK